MRWCSVMRLLYTTTQLGLSVLSIRRLARVGIETLGSFVHWSKSESMMSMFSFCLTCLHLKLTVKMFLLGSNDLLSGCLAHRLGQALTCQTVSRRQDPVIESLSSWILHPDLIWEISEFPHWSETEHWLLVDDREGAAQGQVRYFVLCVSTVSWDTVLPACCCWLCWCLVSLASTGRTEASREGEPVRSCYQYCTVYCTDCSTSTDSTDTDCSYYQQVSNRSDRSLERGEDTTEFMSSRSHYVPLDIDSSKFLVTSHVLSSKVKTSKSQMPRLITVFIFIFLRVWL